MGIHSQQELIDLAQEGEWPPRSQHDLMIVVGGAHAVAAEAGDAVDGVLHALLHDAVAAAWNCWPSRYMM